MQLQESGLTERAPDPRKNTETMVVGVGAFSGTLRGLRLVLSKRRYLVPPTSSNANGWLATYSKSNFIDTFSKVTCSRIKNSQQSS